MNRRNFLGVAIGGFVAVLVGKVDAKPVRVPSSYSRAAPWDRDLAIKKLEEAMKRLDEKITAMKPGDVFARGASERPGLVGNQVHRCHAVAGDSFKTDVKSNAGIGRRILNTSGRG